MATLSGIEPFVEVAEQRSFRKAAERLGVTPAAVSKAVARLEAELGVRLLHRTSRRVAPTAEGDAFLRHCRAALDHLQAGRDVVGEAQRVPQGTVRVSASPILGRPLVRGLPRLLARHPRLAVDLAFTDRLARMIEDDVDIAVRVGPLSDSSLVAHPLRRPRWVTVASPAYLARAGTPSRPEDLGEHECLAYCRPSGQVAEWVFRGQRGDEMTTRPVAPRVLLDSGDLLLEAAAAGAGVAQVLDFMAEAAVADGRLVEVLGDRSVAGPRITALLLPRRRRSPRIRAVIELLDEVMGRHRTPR